MRWAVAVLVVLLVQGACDSPQPAASSGIPVVAGENFWGSLAGQLGGTRVSVQSVVTDPNADPHEYESSPADARAFAGARLVVLNGAGYDGWGRKLLDANPSSGRRVLDVARLLGKKEGDNPHFWYSPNYVKQVADRITAEYKALDAADTGYFDQQRVRLASAFVPFLDEVGNIRSKYSGVSIGATESVFAYMAEALGLKVTTPDAFMNAVAEGNDPPVSAVARFHDQIAGDQIRVLIYNRQTTTAVTTNLVALASAHQIPSVGVSETVQPSNLDYQDWQLEQLQALESALKATS